MAGLFAVVLLLDVASIRHRSTTFDERHHLRFGENILHGILDRKDNSKMPVSALNALPRLVGEKVDFPSSIEQRLSSINAARVITPVFALVLASYVYRWSRALYGDAGGLLSLFLFAFSPNLIGHSGLVTTDLYATCFITVAVYHFWRFATAGGLANAVRSSLTLGLAQLAKSTSIHLYPLFGLILLCRVAADRSDAPLRAASASSLRRLIGWLALFVAGSLLVVNIGFRFHRSMTPFGEYRFRSPALQTVQANAGPLRSVPVPVPYPYLDGLDWVFHDERAGTGNVGDVYLLGERRPASQGFKGYFLYAFLFKEPLALQLLIAASSVVYWRQRSRHHFWRDEIFLLAPTLYFGIYFNFFFHLDIGIRFCLIVLPFLHVFCGSLASDWPAVGKRERALVYALGAYLVISVLSYFPHYLSYFNELVWDRKMAYKILADSNLDWEQGDWYLARYREQHPEAVVEPLVPTAGTIVVGVNHLLGLVPKADYRWLRDHFVPVDQIAHCYLVFEVTPQALQSALVAAGAETAKP